MFRRDLIDILKERPISLHELALLLDERPRDLEDDLQHLFRSLRKDPLCPVFRPRVAASAASGSTSTSWTSRASARAARGPGSASR